jgi:hypothetical protein
MTRSTTSNCLDALRHLISSLLTCLEGYWWNSCDICAFLEHGGVNGIDEKLVQQALHSVAKVEGLIETRFYNDAIYYVFGKDPKSSTPQSQKEAASANLFYLPKMVRNFYTGHRHVEFKASIEVIAGKEQGSPESSTAREETATTIDLTSTAGTTTVVPSSCGVDGRAGGYLVGLAEIAVTVFRKILDVGSLQSWGSSSTASQNAFTRFMVDLCFFALIFANLVACLLAFPLDLDDILLIRIEFIILGTNWLSVPI